MIAGELANYRQAGWWLVFMSLLLMCISLARSIT